MSNPVFCLIFICAAHKQFFEQILSEIRFLDIYRVVFFYLMGLTRDTREHIRELYDFEENCITPEGMDGAAWQTSGTRQVCCLAYNLYNGYVGDDVESYTPCYLFCTQLAPFFVCALQMLYTRYFTEEHEEMIVGNEIWNSKKY